MCAGNVDQLQSWKIEGEIVSDRCQSGRREKGSESFDLRFDGTRISSRNRRCQGTGTHGRALGKDKADYLSLLWDGQKYTKYYRSDEKDSGQVMIDDFSAAPARAKYIEVGALQYGHQACCLVGHARNTFKRIDEVLREASSVTLRAETEPVNGGRAMLPTPRPNTATTPSGSIPSMVSASQNGRSG
ncbi:MAG: hypothetical protein NTZ17_12110 [Phycisphaerae bacterium]|nr:hypothetical protein [Phycisphaerae bacterium]